MISIHECVHSIEMFSFSLIVTQKSIQIQIVIGLHWMIWGSFIVFISALDDLRQFIVFISAFDDFDSVLPCLIMLHLIIWGSFIVFNSAFDDLRQFIVFNSAFDDLRQFIVFNSAFDSFILLTFWYSYNIWEQFSAEMLKYLRLIKVVVTESSIIIL